MAEQQPSGHHARKKRSWDADEIYSLLSVEVRRHIIASLTSGESKTALELSAARGMKRHTYLRHVSALRKAKVIVPKENRKDRREPLYSLSPDAVVNRTKEFVTVDFDCCTMRFPLL